MQIGALEAHLQLLPAPERSVLDAELGRLAAGGPADPGTSAGTRRYARLIAEQRALASRLAEVRAQPVAAELYAAVLDPGKPLQDAAELRRRNAELALLRDGLAQPLRSLVAAQERALEQSLQQAAAASAAEFPGSGGAGGAAAAAYSLAAAPPPGGSSQEPEGRRRPLPAPDTAAAWARLRRQREALQRFIREDVQAAVRDAAAQRGITVFFDERNRPAGIPDRTEAFRAWTQQQLASSSSAPVPFGAVAAAAAVVSGPMRRKVIRERNKSANRR
jgi:hypothetical protein